MVYIAAGAVVCAAFTYGVHPHRPVWADHLGLTPAAIHTLGRPILWIDARTARERDLQPAPGTVWMSESAWDASLEAFLERWTTDQVIVVFCSDTGCRSSSHVARHLAGDLAVAVHTLIGGHAAWRRMQPAP